MRKSLKACALVACVATPAALFAAPANAQLDGVTVVTVTVTGGLLAIVPSAAIAVANTAGAGTATGTTILPTVVTDARLSNAGWTVQANMTSPLTLLTGGTNTIPNSEIDYTAEQPTTTGTVTVAPVQKRNLGTAQTVVSTSSAAGINTATWNFTLDVNVSEVTSVVDAYAGVLTHSIA